MFWLIAIVVLLLLIIALLIAPLFVGIDSRSNTYAIWMPGLINIRFEADEKEIFKAKVVLLFIRFHFYPLNYLGKVKRSRADRQRRKKSNKLKRLRQSLSFIKSFKVERFYLDMDTGDLLLNARLYPLFGLLNYNHGNIHINFEGRNDIVLLIKNRPINIIKSFINP
jgi:hypothetical protein